MVSISECANIAAVGEVVKDDLILCVRLAILRLTMPENENSFFLLEFGVKSSARLFPILAGIDGKYLF